MAEVISGSRVKLVPERDWLSRYAPLADHGRIGTVKQIENSRHAHVEFDVMRQGAKPITGRFSVSDLIEVSSPKVDQLSLVAAATGSAGE
jgi:hypothetical protein